jgi:hypothetical protein
MVVMFGTSSWVRVPWDLLSLHELNYARGPTHVSVRLGGGGAKNPVSVGRGMHLTRRTQLRVLRWLEVSHVSWTKSLGGG